MQLKGILSGVELAEEIPPALAECQVCGLEYDSRRVERGFLFFAFAGAKADGRQFAAQAMARGAVAVVSELPPPEGFQGPWILVRHGRRALAIAARNWFGPPERDLFLTGVTGTNGKTTVTYLCEAVFKAAGWKTVLLGTTGYRIMDETVSAANTTPESLDLYRLFAVAKAKGGTHVAMEVSSHALELGRVYGLAFHSAVFTNLSQDHLDFHGTMEAYFQAKQRLFQANGAAPPCYAILNADDPHSGRIETDASTQRIRYGFSPDAEVRAEEVELDRSGIAFRLRHRGGHTRIRSELLGRVNVYNILAACAAGISYGLDEGTIAAGIASCRSVPGRFERVEEGQPFVVVVDYAHTDDALRNAIAVARSLGPKRVITVFGCGGDRDRQKRPLMGMAAAEASDVVVLTSDNPRSEDPLHIINDALVGLRRYDTPHRVEPDRGKAIRLAIEEAEPGDLVLIAGKGHETYQIIGDRVIEFDDREVARGILREYGYRRRQ